MFDKRRLLTIGFTLSIAFVTGHVMQNGFALTSKTAGKSKTETIQPVSSGNTEQLGAMQTIPQLKREAAYFA